MCGIGGGGRMGSEEGEGGCVGARGGGGAMDPKS